MEVGDLRLPALNTLDDIGRQHRMKQLLDPVVRAELAAGALLAGDQGDAAEEHRSRQRDRVDERDAGQIVGREALRDIIAGHRHQTEEQIPGYPHDQQGEDEHDH